MAVSKRNNEFRKAKLAKKDEFYTSLEVIEKELDNYQNLFEDKVVYCNCDDPRESNFFRYFADNFENLRLKRLVTTCYRNIDPELFGKKNANQAVYLNYTMGNASSNKNGTVSDLKLETLAGDGDFRSKESVELLKQADIVVTNPPFSLFREYVSQLIKHHKKFLIIGNMNAVTYKEIFPLIQQNKMWYGPSIRSGDREFRVPDDYPLTAAGYRVDKGGRKYIRVKGIRWFTNLDYPTRHETLQLTKLYDPKLYPKYANFDAIEVSKTMDIPIDYEGPMGVPISFLDKYNPKQFNILGSSKSMGTPMSQLAERGTYQQGGPRFYLANPDGSYKRMYERIVIQHKRANKPSKELDLSK